MSLSQTINYDVAGNFSYDSNLIQFLSGSARLKLINNTGQQFSQAFASDTGFSFSDAAKVEVAGGVLRQKSQAEGAVFGAQLRVTENANFGGGDLTATLFGGAQISSQKLDLRGPGKWVEYDATDNVSNIGLVGTIKIRFTPNYNGSPAANQAIFTLADISDTNKSKIQLLHLSNGNLFLLANDNTGANILSNSLLPYSAVLGEEGEIEISWDLVTDKKFRCFGSGYLFAEIAADYVRDDTTYFALGDTDSDFLIRDLMLFDTVLHTADFPGGVYEVPESAYVFSETFLPAMAYGGLGAIQAYSNFSATVVGAPRFTVNGKYWNGAAWVNAGGYAQSNTVAQIAANIATLPVQASTVIGVYFTETTTQNTVDDAVLTYTGQIYPTSNPAVINNSGVTTDDVEGFLATVTVTGSDLVKYQISLSAVLKYWNGAAWATSDGTYAQSNTAAEIIANLSTLNVSAGATLKVRALLHSNDGSTTPHLTSVTVDYSFYTPVSAEPTRCVVYAHLRDIVGGTVATDMQLVVENDEPIQSGDVLIAPTTQTFESNGSGYVEADLVESATTGTSYKFTILYVIDGVQKTSYLGRAMVPVEVSKNLATLQFAARKL